MFETFQANLTAIFLLLAFAASLIAGIWCILDIRTKNRIKKYKQFDFDRIVNDAYLKQDKIIDQIYGDICKK